MSIVATVLLFLSLGSFIILCIRVHMNPKTLSPLNPGECDLDIVPGCVALVRIQFAYFVFRALGSLILIISNIFCVPNSFGVLLLVFLWLIQLVFTSCALVRGKGNTFAGISLGLSVAFVTICLGSTNVGENKGMGFGVCLPAVNKTPYYVLYIISVWAFTCSGTSVVVFLRNYTSKYVMKSIVYVGVMSFYAFVTSITFIVEIATFSYGREFALITSSLVSASGIPLLILA